MPTTTTATARRQTGWILNVFLSLTIVTTTRAFSATISNNKQSAPTNFATFQLQKLREAGLLDSNNKINQQRPYTIRAFPVDSDNAVLSDRTNHNNNDDDTTFVTSKIVHFQRHGQGYHNLIGEMVRELTGQVMIDLDQTDSTLNPFVRPELVDSPLTETGRQECVAQQKQKDSRIQPQRIIVSPLTRALQTAVLSFPDERATVPWTAHEGVREQLGLLTCNQRSNVQHLQEAFSHVDFTLLESDHDAVWQPHERELPRHEVERIYTFLVEYVSTLPEHQVAVVGHSAWLFTMMHAVVECSNDNLKRLFATSEIRSMRLEWYRTEDRLGG